MALPSQAVVSRSSSAQEVKSGHAISGGRLMGRRFRGRLEAKVGVAKYFAGERPQKVEDSRLPPLVFAEGLVVHEEVDDRLFPSDPVEPVGVFGRREWILGPMPVGEAEGHVVREAVVPQQELQFLQPAGLYTRLGLRRPRIFSVPSARIVR